MNNQLAYINLIPENREMFALKVTEIANRLGIQANWLMIVFYIETGAAVYGQINHRIKNALGATGLLQFMPRTLLSMGLTSDVICNMSNVQQLEVVYRYLAPYASRIKSLTDCYLAVLFPVAMGKPEQFVLQTATLSAQKVARWNPLYDLNKDMQITVGEVSTKLKTFIPPGIAA
jgi:AraC-like DNA-binding protein